MRHSTAVDVACKYPSNTQSHLSCGSLRATARAVTPDLLLGRAPCAGRAVTTTPDPGSAGRTPA